MPEAETMALAPTGANTGWWGLACLIATEGSLFAYLLFSYAYIAVQHGPGWLPERHPSLAMSGPNTLVLLASSVAVWWGERGGKTGRTGQRNAGLAIAIALGLVFLTVQIFEWKSKSFGIATGAYGSLFFTITGFHMAHVIAGVLILSVVLGWSAAGLLGRKGSDTVSIAAVYWHFVDAVWLFVFSAFYLSPYLMGAGA